jgi:membrane protein insertase Oxa1/YidC/SpoIIIJ
MVGQIGQPTELTRNTY